MVRVLYRVVCLVAPAVAMALGVPLALAPFSGDPRGIFGPYIVTALPVYVSVVAAPGYVVAVLGEREPLHRSSMKRWWVRMSLALGALCSLAGVLGSSLMFLFLPPSLVTLVCVGVVWAKFERKE
jgi:hypothetical protein